MKRFLGILLFLVGLSAISYGVFLQTNLVPETSSDSDDTSIYKTNNQKTIVNTDKYIKIVRFSNQKTVSGILENGTVKSLNVKVFTPEGKESRSFDYSDNDIYYIDENKTLNKYSIRYDKTEKLVDVNIIDFADLYVINNGIFIFTARCAYIYRFAEQDLIEISIDSPCSYTERYYNKNLKTMYYRDGQDKIASYNIETKQEVTLFDNYSIAGELSNDTYLVLKKANVYYLNNYTDSDLMNILDVNNSNGEMLYLKNSSIIYAQDNKISESFFNGTKKDLYEFELDQTKQEKISSFQSISSSSNVFIQINSNNCSEDNTCNSETKKVYLFDFITNKPIDITKYYKNYFKKINN